MSITISGTLQVKSISGARGAFSVGDLTTDIGSFRIKDALLDEFEPGTYKGRFVIASIFPFSYSWRGKVSIEVRAKLVEILLDDADHRIHVACAANAPTVEPEPDPIDEEVAAVPASPVTENRAAAVPVVEAAEATTLFDDELQSVIDEGGPVKLDPTIDRAAFRQQRDRLKELGFRFEASAQHWIKS